MSSMPPNPGAPQAPAPAPLDTPAMSKPIVTPALFDGQHAVCFGSFFKHYFGRGVVRIFVG